MSYEGRITALKIFILALSPRFLLTCHSFRVMNSTFASVLSTCALACIVEFQYVPRYLIYSTNSYYPMFCSFLFRPEFLLCITMRLDFFLFIVSPTCSTISSIRCKNLCAYILLLVIAIISSAYKHTLYCLLSSSSAIYIM